MEDAKSTKFTDADTKALLEAIEPFKPSIKLKDRDSESRKKVKKAWQDIANAFNSSPLISAPKSVDKLKKKWENCVQTAKKEQSKFRQEVKQTGGGPPPAPLPNTSQQVMDILGADCLPLENTFDSDRGHHEDKVVHVEQPLEATLVTPKKLDEKFVYSKRRRAPSATASTLGATDEILEMAREKHEKEIQLLDVQIKYWKKKFETEFGPNHRTLQNISGAGATEYYNPEMGANCNQVSSNYYMQERSLFR